MSRLSLLRWPYVAPLTLAGLLFPAAMQPPAIDPALYAGLVWRNVGPFRAGRIAAVSGVVGQPGVFYVGTPAGGVWKTTSAGETWFPVFDSVRTVSSIGAIEVAPSDPNVIYAGTGDMATGGAVNEGNGVYKSTDAGKSWQHLGLDATKQIPSMLVDPRDPNLVMIAAQGNVHQRSETRGVFRSTDGGRTWTKTLYVDDQTGIQKLARAFDVPSVIFATTVRHYVAPGTTSQRGAAPDTGRTGTALYKSTDEGLTWQEITGGGLPRLSGRTSLAVAMNTNAQRVFLISNSGLYRSDDGGTTWRQMAAGDERIRNGQGGYNCGVYVDPKNPDLVYTINTSSYKSTDGGNTFTGFKGAPGGDDPQQMWIDPANGQRILLGLDQGAVVSLDGGTTWSSWYNQSTEQVYHLAVDTSFPYWIYATQQDAGAVRTRARGNLGAVTPLDWNPVNGWEWGTVVPDPVDPKVVYATGVGIFKILYPSEQWINVSPATDPSLKLRTSFSQPIVFAPWNQRELLAGFQYLMATTDGGVHWKKLSPDLGVPKGGEATLAGGTAADNGPRPPLGGAIETISASTVAAGTIWAGTNNGLIKLTRDEGRTWQDVSIPGLPNPTRALISTIDASHNDAGEAYVAIDYHTTGDYAPYVYRTRDFGKTWTKIVDGLARDEPAGSFARVVRADTKKAGLLFAGTETSMYVSFDDGDHWESLTLNLPMTSFRDLAIKDNDLVVGTYGRGIWVLDEFTVLRQVTPQVAAEAVHLYKPADAVRVRRNVNADTPFPPEVPHALNPPDGAIVYYSFAQKPASEIKLEVSDAAGNVVRHMSSAPEAPVAEASHPPEPSFWLAPPSALPTNTGMNRVNWDLRYDAPPAFTHSYEINANPGQTRPSPEGPLAAPGTYTLKLIVDGRSYTQTLTVRNDPRSAAIAADLRAQQALLINIARALRLTWDGYQQASALRAAAAAAAPSGAPADVSAAVAAYTAKLDSIAGNAQSRGGFRRGREGPPSFKSVNGEFVGQLSAQDNADFAPTAAMLGAYANACADLGSAAVALKDASTRGLSSLNVVLEQHDIRPVAAPSEVITAPSCVARGAVGGRL